MGQKRTKCVRCRFRPCESKDGVCKTCRDNPDRTARVEELREGLAWAVRTFGKTNMRGSDACSVVGAAKEKPGAVLVYFSPVTVIPDTFVFGKISIDVALRVF